MPHPIDNIKWLDIAKLNPNDYNPNVVFTPELKLLEFSILKQGWIQPILINQDNIIIDGFHRYSLVKHSKKVSQISKDKVPCAILTLTESERMLLTIRINRAKGSHIAIKMHDIIKTLVEDHGMAQKEIAKQIGATTKEIDLLLMENIFKKFDTKNHKYSKAWYPK